MISGWTEDQEDLRSVVRRFLADRSPSDVVRAQADAGAIGDPAVWQQMVSQLGLVGLAIPEAHGGTGMGPVELGVVLEEMGRVLYVGPYFSTVVLAGQTLTTSGEAGGAWLSEIAEGRTATVAISDGSCSFATADVSVVAKSSGDNFALTGSKAYAIDGATADFIVVAAVSDGELGLFVVEGDAPGLTRTPVGTVDITRAVARLDLLDVEATRLTCDPLQTVSRAADLAAASLAAEQIGGRVGGAGDGCGIRQASSAV